MAMLLVFRLSQFHDLYHAVDEQRAIPTSALENEAIDATIADFSRAIESSEKAIFHAYLALFRAGITQHDTATSEHDKALRLQTLLGICITDLARIYNHRV
jgi:hypothetical protein